MNKNLQVYEIKETPNKDFSCTKPFGYILAYDSFKKTQSWCGLFVQLLNDLAIKEPDQFKGLPKEYKFSSLFSETSSYHYKKLDLDHLGLTLYVNVNLSANYFGRHIENLLAYFGIKMKIYLI